MKKRHHRRKLLPAAISLLSALCLLFSGGMNAQQTQAQSDASAPPEFKSKLREYMKVHHGAEKGLPHLTAAPSGDEIIQRQKKMAERIRTARAQAKEGSIFTTAVSAYFAARIRAAYEENGEGIRACLAGGSPLPKLGLQANTEYPEGVSYSMMPPTILRHLPKLPKELQYQVVCSDLILRDVEANLIVDVLRNAIP